jgi:cytoskeletal protein CcmA (bactofilin family)/Tfp pilus assembly protein PilX
MYKALRHFIKKQNGQLLPMVLIFLVVGSLLVVSTLSFVDTGIKAGQKTETRTDELYSADAGVGDALWKIENDSASLPSAIGQNLTYNILDVNGKSISVDIQYNKDDALAGKVYKVVSSATTPALGSNPSTTTTITAYIASSEGGGTFIFDNAITSLGGGISVTGGAIVTGDVFSNGTLYVSSTIDGDVYAESGITMNWGGQITGDAYTPGTITQPQWSDDMIDGDNNSGAANEDPETIPPEQVDTMIADTLAETTFTPMTAGPVTHIGDTLFQPWWPPPESVFPDAVHVSGNLQINGATDINFNSSVYVDGNLTMDASGKIITFNGPVVVEGSIYLQNGTAIFNSSVYVAGNLTLAGSAIATFNGQVLIVNNLDPGSGGSVAFNNTLYVGGDLYPSGDRDVYIGDAVYIGGDLNLSGGSQIIGGQTIVVMGNVTLSGGTKLDNEEIPFLLVPTGGFSLTGGAYASAVIYAPEADVNLEGGTNLYGSIICNSISCGGGAIIEYPEGLEDQTNIPGGGSDSGEAELSILTWEIILS